METHSRTPEPCLKKSRAGPHIRKKLLAKREHTTLILTSGCLKQVNTFHLRTREVETVSDGLAIRICKSYK